MNSAPPFVFRTRITYAQCTLGNHVYYSRYLDLLEEARGEFFRALGFPLLDLQSETVFPVIECSLKYLKPARYDDWVDISVSVSALSPVRLNFSSEISRAGEVLVRAETAHVCATPAEKPKRIPPELRAALELQLKDKI